MNIYLHVENSIRELDSKLLLGVLAAEKGYDVLISDIEGIEKGLKRKLLAPGIFHTKSLTPGKIKIKRHKNMIKGGNVVTSIDEENSLIKHGYEQYAKWRYSNETIKDSAAVFCWGPEDSMSLKKTYPKFSSKIHKTGSPRADLWRPIFNKYWKLSNKFSKKPFLLVVSNMSYANYARPFSKIISTERKNGHYKRNPKLFLENFQVASEHYKITASFIDAIRYLSKNNTGYNIIVRPHQNENLKTWQIYLEDIPNVRVIREGSITSWIKNAFAVMHNGCTTALETTICKKPLLTFVPFSLDYGNDLSNELGYKIKNKNELLLKVNWLFKNRNSKNKNNLKKNLPKQVTKKIFIDENELAAKKILQIWEDLIKIHKNDLNKKSNWIIAEIHFKLMKINGIIFRFFRTLITLRFHPKNNNFKFPPLDKDLIYKKVDLINHILNLKIKLKCKLLSERSILIRKL